MSYAVIQTGGKQYKVKSGEILKIEKLPGSKPDTKIEFNLRKQSFKRSILNIIENSKRYSKNIEINIKKTEDSLVIFIDDDGPGINKKDRENALRPFYRLETSRNKNTGGTGLGLSIANNIILSHGGKLELLSSPLGGLRVKLSLPQ